MFYKYLEDALNNEIIPAIVSPELTLEDLKGFADAVFDRFQNPFIKLVYFTLLTNTMHRRRNFLRFLLSHLLHTLHSTEVLKLEKVL